MAATSLRVLGPVLERALRAQFEPRDDLPQPETTSFIFNPEDPRDPADSIQVLSSPTKPPTQNLQTASPLNGSRSKYFCGQLAGFGIILIVCLTIFVLSAIENQQIQDAISLGFEKWLSKTTNSVEPQSQNSLNLSNFNSSNSTVF